MSRAAKVRFVCDETHRSVSVLPPRGVCCIRKYAWRPFSVPRITFQRAKNETPHRERATTRCVRRCVCVVRNNSPSRARLIVYFREMRTNGTGIRRDTKCIYCKSRNATPDIVIERPVLIAKDIRVFK